MTIEKFYTIICIENNLVRCNFITGLSNPLCVVDFFVEGEMGDIVYDKPFKTYKEQIEILKNKYKLNIKNENFALELLSTISYYDLINGSKESFFEKDSEIFEENTDIIDLFLFKILDKNIQNTLFKYSVYVENIFKTKMAYLISRKYGISIEQYLNEKNYYLPINFQRREKRNQTLKTILAVATDNKYKNDPTEYYKKYHNHIPAWILFKNVNFTDIIDLYSFFKLEDKLEIAKEYCNNASQLKDEELVELLKNSITIVRKFRNRIAHNLKVITYRAKGNNLKLKNIKNFLPNQFIGKNNYKNKIGINDLFSMISSITFLLKNETLIFQMFSELKADFNLISLQKMVKKYKKVTNFPQNIEKRFDMILGKEK